MSSFFGRLAASTAFMLCLLTAAGARTAETNVCAEEAMQRLKDGNRRFADGKAAHAHQQPERRAEVAKGQKPFAIVVCCSDSRVGPEIVFDQGLGDIDLDNGRVKPVGRAGGKSEQ